MKHIKKEWYVVLVILLVMTSTIMIRPLNDLDEIWNYNFARNILEGNMPYKDFNMIQMPLVPSLCAIFLAVLGNELIVMRILAILLCTAILFITYKILELLKVNKQLNYLFLIFLILIFSNHFRIDYNFFVLFNILLIIYMEFKEINNHKEGFLSATKVDIFLGVFAGICICSKQTTGIIISIVLIGHYILQISNLKEFKLFIKKAIYRVIGVLIPLLILAIYFTINNLWVDFIDYCVLGISTFTNSIPYSNLLNCRGAIIKILSVLVPMFIIGSLFVMFYYKYKKKEFDKKLLTIVVYSIAEFVVVFPISDEIHFLLGAFPAMIGIMYIVSILSKKVRNKMVKKFIKEYLTAFNFLVAIICSITSIILLYNYGVQAIEYNNLEHFDYILQSEEQMNSIKVIDEYMEKQSQNVYILDASAAIYTIPINRYTKNYDMFLIGNLGADGEDGIIEDLQKEENYIILIKNEQYSRNWQNPEKVRKYIIENMNKTRELEIFDIYEK